MPHGPAPIRRVPLLAAWAALYLLLVPNLFGQEVTVSGAWVRPTPPYVTRTALYATLHNAGGQDDRLIAVAADIAERAEIHETVNEGGMLRMQPAAGGVALPAGGETQLKPGGYHVMLSGLKSAIWRGGSVAVTLTFEHAGEVHIEAVAADEPPPGE